jgi:hypothetical protein
MSHVVRNFNKDGIRNGQCANQEDFEKLQQAADGKSLELQNLQDKLVRF